MRSLCLCGVPGAAQVPRERLLLETDCPDATPPAHEGGPPLLPVATGATGAAECPGQDKGSQPQATSRLKDIENTAESSDRNKNAPPQAPSRSKDSDGTAERSDQNEDSYPQGLSSSKDTARAGAIRDHDRGSQPRANANGASEQAEEELRGRQPGKGGSSQPSDRLDCGCGGQGVTGGADRGEQGEKGMPGGKQGGEKEAQQPKASPRPLNHPGNITHVSSRLCLEWQEESRQASAERCSYSSSFNTCILGTDLHHTCSALLLKSFVLVHQVRGDVRSMFLASSLGRCVLSPRAAWACQRKRWRELPTLTHEESSTTLLDIVVIARSCKRARAMERMH